MKSVLRSWKFWLVLSIVVIILIYLFHGSRDSKFIGIGDYDDVMAVYGIDEFPEEKTNIVHEQNIPNEDTNSRSFVSFEKSSEKKRKTKKCSKGEQECRDILELIFGGKFPTKRPNFLKNPETGRNLELDCYNEELKLALEYNGKQHYVYPNAFHKSKQDFMQQLRRDRYKKLRCDQEGVFLITVPYNVPNIRDHILKHIPHTLIPSMAMRLIESSS